MDTTKSPSNRGRKKKIDTDTPISIKEKEFVEGSGLSRDEIKVGYKLMAASFDSKWYQGRIVEVDESDNTFLVHFDFWNSRFDEWYKFTTKKVKPLSEEPYTRKKLTPKFKLGDTVIARWVDGRQYRGNIEQIKPNDSYDVMFEDGVVISADVTTLKLGDRLDVSIEEERLAKRNELFKRSREREFRSKKRSLEPGASLPRLSLELDDIRPSVTAVKYASKLPDSLSLKISYSLKKVCLTYEFDANTNVFVSRGDTYDVPSAVSVLGADTHTTTTTTTTILAVEDTPPESETPVNSPRKRGRPRIYSPSHTSPSTLTKSQITTTPPKHISPNKNTPVKKLKNVRIPSVSPTPISPVNDTPTKCTVSVQTDPIPELAETRPPLNPPMVAPQGMRPHYPVPPVPPQPAPPLLQTETVLTSDGRWITIATPPMAAPPPLQIHSDVTQRQTPASNMYYQLVPMGANGPIHQPPIVPPPPPALTLPPSQPQDPLSHLVLTQPPHNPLMMLPPTRSLLQNSAPYIQPRPILQYQPHSANTVLMHANPLHQQVILPQQAVVNNSVQETAPQIAQRQTDPPSAMNLSANSPVPVSPLPCTSPTDPVPPVTSNLAASRATLRLPDVQAAAPVMVTPQVLSEQRENGENLSPTPILSLSSRLPFSSLLSNTIQPSPSLPNAPQVTTVSQQSGEIATIFAPSCPTPIVTTVTELTHDDPPTSDPTATANPPPDPSEVPAPLETTEILKSQIQAANVEQTESS